ncbi:MAG: 3-phosphoshikimate 1-carboxyvinyltransferase [Flavisolibacter sp.]|nr:3-phosphoshikimate 1-carboxyvinyltransferase [Flavisolibacter sp.]
MRSLFVNPEPISREESVIIPGDKSISHRVIIAGILSPGTVTIENVNKGDAVNFLVQALDQLGITVKETGDQIELITPAYGFSHIRNRPYLNLGPSSAPARFLIGLLAGYNIEATVDGDSTLRARPMDWVVEPLKELGANIEYDNQWGCLPVTIHKGRIRSGSVNLSVGSAQAQSAMLFASLGAECDIQVTNIVQSRDHTDRLLKHLGIPITRLSGNALLIKGKAPAALRNYKVPGDPSLAAFPIAVHVMQKRKTELELNNICLNPTRIGIFQLLKEIGADISWDVVGESAGEPVGVVKVGPYNNSLKPFVLKDKFFFHSLIDEVPLACAIATMIDGVSAILGGGELTFKETNRLITTRDMLSAFGADVRVEGDAIYVRGAKPLKAGRIPSFNDHRIAMAAAVLSSSLSEPSEIIEGESHKCSFPEFVDCIKSIGVDISL